MKKLVYVISCISLLLLSSCHRMPPKWRHMPNDLFSSYFPYQEGDTIRFCSDDLDSLTYTCSYNMYDARLFCFGGYSVNNDLRIDEISHKTFQSILLWTRVGFEEPYDVNNKPNTGEAEIWAYYGDSYYDKVMLHWNLAESTLYEIYTQDYDVASEDNSARFYLKKGEGIVWFEYEGVRYTQIK